MVILFCYMTKFVPKWILENNDYYFCLFSFWKNCILKETWNKNHETIFEMQVFITFDFQKVLIDQINDPDINFFNDKSGAGDSLDFSSGEFNSLSEKILKNWLSILLINIMRLNKNYGKLRKYFSCKKGFHCYGSYRHVV